MFFFALLFACSDAVPTVTTGSVDDAVTTPSVDFGLVPYRDCRLGVAIWTPEGGPGVDVGSVFARNERFVIEESGELVLCTGPYVGSILVTEQAADVEITANDPGFVDLSGDPDGIGGEGLITHRGSGRLSLSYLELKNGSAELGGAVYSEGDLAVHGVRFEDNRTEGSDNA